MYPDALLDQSRLEGDPIADRVIGQLFQEEGKGKVIGNLRKLSGNNTDVSHFPDFLRDYFQTQALLPEWADTKRMAIGHRLFEKQAPLITSMLGFLSLPYDYAGANGAKVLAATGRLLEDASRRLPETAVFLFDVMDPKAFTDSGNGFISALKVRLIHAMVRYRVKASHNWNMDLSLIHI